MTAEDKEKLTDALWEASDILESYPFLDHLQSLIGEAVEITIGLSTE